MSRNARDRETAAQRTISNEVQAQSRSRRQYATTIFLMNPPRKLIWAATAYQKNGQQSEEEQRYYPEQKFFEKRHHGANSSEKGSAKKQFKQCDDRILPVEYGNTLTFNTQPQPQNVQEKNLFLIKNTNDYNSCSSTAEDNLLSGRAQHQNDFISLCGFNSTPVFKHRTASLSSSCSVSSPNATFTSSAPAVSQPLAVVSHDAWQYSAGHDSSNNHNNETLVGFPHRQLIETLLKTFSRQRRLRRASIGDHATSTVTSKRQVIHSQIHVGGVTLRFRVPSVLASPRQLISNPLRGLRRAASSASSINCCGNQGNASYASSASTAFLSAASIHAAYPYPRSHTPLMVLPSRAGTTTTVYLPSHITSPVFSSQSSLLSSSRYGSRDNNYFGDNVKITDLSHITTDSSYGSEWSASSTDQPASYNSLVIESRATSTYALGNEEPHNQPLYSFATRPPLNRAIPPIPESKSNESIISAHTHAHNVYLRLPSTQPSHLAVHDKIDADSNNKDKNKHENENENSNLIKNNKAASTNGVTDLVSAKFKDAIRKDTSAEPYTGKSSPLKNEERKYFLAKRKDPLPKSPLTSMAYIMRNRFSKLGTRFGRSYDSDSPTRAAIRSSKSMQAMKRDTPSNEVTIVKSTISRPSAASKLLKSPSFGSRSQNNRHRSIELISEDNSSIDADCHVSDAATVPRRLLSTTLIPSTVRSLPTRLPPDDLPLPSLLTATPIHSILKNNNIKNNEETKLDLNNNDCATISNGTQTSTPTQKNDNMSSSALLPSTNAFEECVNKRVVHFDVMLPRSPVILRRAVELEFVKLDYYRSVYKPFTTTAPVTVKRKKEKEEKLRNIEDESLLLENSARAKAVLLVKNEEKPSGSDLWRIPTGRMRKTSSSFPPMSASICTISEQHRQPPRSLSIGADERDSRRNILYHGKISPLVTEKCVQRNESLQTTRRSLFSTYSLRQAASRIVEASPRLRRRVRATSAVPHYEDHEFTPIKASFVVNLPSRRRLVFRKSVSLPEKKASKKRKGKIEKENCNVQRAFIRNENNGGQLLTATAKDFETRTINAVRQRRGNQRAPLAEIESSRVAENSPAVELPPFCTISAFHQQRQARVQFTPAHWQLITPTTKCNKTEELKATISSSVLGISNNNDNHQDNNNEASGNKELPLSISFGHEGTVPPSPPSEPPSVVSTEKRVNAIFGTYAHDNNFIIGDQQTQLSQSEITFVNDVSCVSNSSPTLHAASLLTSVKPTIACKPSRIAKWNWGRLKQQKQDQGIQSKTKETMDQKKKVINLMRRDGEALGSYDSSECGCRNLPLSMEREASLDLRLKRMQLCKGKTQFFESGNTIGRNKREQAGDERCIDYVQLASAAGDKSAPALPEVLADLKRQLSNLQDEIHNDYGEIERLRVENEKLQKKLESRDAIIEALRTQLEASGKL